MSHVHDMKSYLNLLGPLICNKVLSEAIRETKGKFLGEPFKVAPHMFIPLDDIYTPLYIKKKCKDKRMKR